jgi:hypothetical protein
LIASAFPARSIGAARPRLLSLAREHGRRRPAEDTADTVVPPENREDHPPTVNLKKTDGQPDEP